MSGITERWEYKRICSHLDTLSPGLSGHIRRLPALPEETAVAAGGYLLAGCCDSTNEIWVVLCREKIWQLPGDWLTEKLEKLIKAGRIDLTDDYEYANLLAALAIFEKAAKKLAGMGLASPNLEVREYAADYLAEPTSYDKLIAQTKAQLESWQ